MSRDADCTAFLQWALPRMGLRWAGFRKVRGQVCKRLYRRLNALDLADLAAYRTRLERDGPEWRLLDGLCRITISRFYRDQGVFDRMRAEILAVLCEKLGRLGTTRLRCLSLGCGGGEEPYTLSLLWRFDLAPRFPDMSIEIHATDDDVASLERARCGRYSAGSLKDLPSQWRNAAFAATDAGFRLRSEHRQPVTFLRQDMRQSMPAGPFNLVLCRNVAFTYFDADGQRRAAAAIAARMASGGILVLGKHERLPADCPGFETVSEHQAIYRRTDDPAAGLNARKSR